MKKNYKQLVLATVIAASMTSGISANDTVAQALENANWSSMAASVNTAGLQGSVDSNAEKIAKVEGMPVTEDTTFTPAAVPAQYVTSMTEESLKPYIGKKVTSITVDNVPEKDRERVMALLDTKVGDEVSLQNIALDVAALGNLGVFAEVNPTFKEVPEGVQLSFELVANPVVRGVVVEGNTIYPQQDLLRYLDVPVGEVLNTVTVGQRIQGVDMALNRDGYMLAHVTGVDMSPEGILHIYMMEGIVQDIEVQGNTKTKSRVITREMLQGIGKPLNKFLVRRSLQRIYNLGFFSDVNMRILPGKDDNHVILAIDVIEQKTGVITVGAGYSESNGFSGIFEVGENNLRGTGDKVNLHWEFGGKASGPNYSVSYTRPWIDNKATSLSGTFFHRTAQYTDYNEKGESFSTYDKKSQGVSLTLGRQTGLFTRDYLTAETRDDKWLVPGDGGDAGDYSGAIYDRGPFGPGGKWSDYRSNNFGTTNSLTFQRVFDSRDNIYEPTAGHRYFTSIQWAGHGLGGDFNFYKISAEARTYKDLGHNHVLAFRLGGGYISGTAGYSQLFAIGGSNTLRGYEDNQFRGKKFYNGTVEYRVPLFKKVTGVVFVDVGDAWDAPEVPWYKGTKRFNVGYGPGLRIQTPIGPVRLDYGYGRDGGKFTFAFGGQF